MDVSNVLDHGLTVSAVVSSLGSWHRYLRPSDGHHEHGIFFQRFGYRGELPLCLSADRHAVECPAEFQNEGFSHHPARHGYLVGLHSSLS